jgi:hypothetical protein
MAEAINRCPPVRKASVESARQCHLSIRHQPFDDHSGRRFEWIISMPSPEKITAVSKSPDAAALA